MKVKYVFGFILALVFLSLSTCFAMEKLLPEYFELILVDFSTPPRFKEKEELYFNPEFKSIVEEELVDDAHPVIKIAKPQSSTSFRDTTTPHVEVAAHTSFSNGSRLTKQSGVCQGPSGKETYYNLNMAGVVNIMRGMGFSEEEYPYWVRDDGCKMLGNYIMVAANLDLRPRGSLIETSLGMGIVCDTGGFAAIDKTQLDIAVSW